MAEVQKTAAPVTPQTEAPPRFSQVIKDTDPQATEEKMRAAGMNMRKYGSCAPSRMHKAVPEDERVLGCPCWKQCTLTKIKAVAGPINLPYRLFKKGGLVREGWGPCFTVFRMADQYNQGNENYVMEILPLGHEVEVRGSKLVRLADGTETWEDTLTRQTPPPFPKLGERGHLIHEVQAARIREEMKQKRAERFVNESMGITPEDVEAADKKSAGQG